MVHLSLRSFGTIQPFSDAEPGQQILGHLDDARLGHGRLALCLELRVLFFHPRADRSHSLADELGDRALLLGDLGEHRVAACLARAQTLRLRTLGNLGRRLEMGPVAARAAVTAVAGLAGLGCSVTWRAVTA